MEEILSLIMGSLFAFFPILFFLVSRRGKRERKKEVSGQGPGSGSEQPSGPDPLPGQKRSQRQERKNFDQPESIVARIMRSQGIRQITGDPTPASGMVPEPTTANPKDLERNPVWSPEQKIEQNPVWGSGQKPEGQWHKEATEKVQQSEPRGGGQENPEPLRGIPRIEGLPKLQQAVVWAEVLGKPRGY